ncbi:MAG: acyl carrier protein [Symploca sp. SIO2E6]|nr:acyl carrier protein [Symploca sp. SIO2E6]
MAVLECIKPGVKPGQVVLAVDLTTAGSTDEALAAIEQLGYSPEIRHIAYPSGVHVLAILKDEQYESVADDYLLDEWQQLLSVINPDAVHLWRGKAS